VTEAAMPGDRRQLPFDFAHDPDYGADSFIEAPSNRAALAWVARWPDWPGPGLAVHGPAGSGKTHLGAIWQSRTNAVAVPLAALAPDRVPALLGSARAALVDGMGADDDAAAAGPMLDAAGERGLFHLHNLLAETGGHLLLLARTPPARWQIGLADLASRLAALPAVRIDPPDDALLQALLAKLFADRQLEASGDAIAYLLPRMERSFEAARRLVAALDRRALASGRRISVALVRDTLAEFETGAGPL
jgi:chromosomal replication initiation ATPase DnaA